MEFLSIPVEVIEGSMLPYLGWNDLLRLRRVSKSVKAIVDDYINQHPELTPEIEINEGEKSFRAYLEMNVPTTKICLNVSSAKFFEEESEDIFEFLDQFGPLIKHLHVSQLPPLIKGKERGFLEALENLQSLEADCLQLREEPGNSRKAKKRSAKKKRRGQQELSCGRPELPSVFKQLTNLCIRYSQDLSLDTTIYFCEAVFHTAKSLECVTLPLSQDPIVHMPGIPGSGEFSAPFVTAGRSTGLEMLIRYMKSRSLEDAPGGRKLKLIDLIGYYMENERQHVDLEWLDSKSFIDLCVACIQHDVLLKSVPARWLNRDRSEFPEVNFQELGRSIVTLLNIHPAIFSIDMPNLERIDVCGTQDSTPGPNWQVERPEWPSLKTLVVGVNSARGGFIEYNADEDRIVDLIMETRFLFKFLFEGITRTALTSLCLQYIDLSCHFPVPKLEDVARSCPNVKNLILINWPGTNKALTKLWRGLPNLEMVTFEYCKHLGNSAFVGEDLGSPLFLGLTKLKSLTLKGLDKMPKITDTLFTLVIRNMSLTNLTLTSDAPINSVTPAGIRSLLGGRFAESIHNFSFQQWSLANVSKEEFKKLEKMFRSYSML